MEETRLRQAALAYVINLYDELTQENGAPPLGTQNQAVDFILGDPELRRALMDWAANAEIDEATMAPPRRPPYDTLYHRVRIISNPSSDDESSRPRTSPVGEREPVPTTPSSRQDRGVYCFV